MIRRLGLCLVLLLTACTTRLAATGASAASANEPAVTPAASAKSPPSALPSALASPPPAEQIASSEAAPAARPKIASLPQLDASLRKQLGKEGIRRFEFLRSICPISLQQNGTRRLVGCRVCPPFEEATPDGKAPEVGFDPGEFYELEGLTPGSFTRAGADEMAAVFSGCEAADENRGWTLLAERAADGLWVARKYKSGLHPNACVALKRPDGRDLLVCRWEYAHQGLGHASILVQDFAQESAVAGAESWTNWVMLEDNAVSICMDLEATPTLAASSSVTTARIDGLELLPSVGRTAGLVVHAHAWRGKASAAYLALCRNWLHEKVKANPRHIDVRPGLNAPAMRLEFLWNGRDFEPSAVTQAILRKLAPKE